MSRLLINSDWRPTLRAFDGKETLVCYQCDAKEIGSSTADFHCTFRLKERSCFCEPW
eukprot:m.111009 g.111009  ORF g.111009 m.111009 type:complete len:57 (-) comp12909_c0_seq3:2183-2353(-)